jgi:hypothetical protein
MRGRSYPFVWQDMSTRQARGLKRANYISYILSSLNPLLSVWTCFARRRDKFIRILQDLSSGVCEKGEIRREGCYWLWATRQPTPPRQPVMSSINSITLFYPYLKIVQEISVSKYVVQRGPGWWRTPSDVSPVPLASTKATGIENRPICQSARAIPKSSCAESCTNPHHNAQNFS